MMKSVFWWRKPEYPDETTDLQQVTAIMFDIISVLSRKTERIQRRRLPLMPKQLSFVERISLYIRNTALHLYRMSCCWSLLSYRNQENGPSSGSTAGAPALVLASITVLHAPRLAKHSSIQAHCSQIDKSLMYDLLMSVGRPDPKDNQTNWWIIPFQWPAMSDLFPSQFLEWKLHMEWNVIIWAILSGQCSPNRGLAV